METTITAELVKKLRDRANIPMMKCKQALAASVSESANGESAWLDAAYDWLRKNGVNMVDKKAGNVTANGAFGLATDSSSGAIVLLTCETDFVAGNTLFKEFVNSLAEVALINHVSSTEALKDVLINGQTVSQAIAEKIQQLGENMQLKEVVLLVGNQIVVGYNHVGKVATLVSGTGNAATLYQVALHVTASNPVPASLNRESIDRQLIDKEVEILMATPELQAKPEALRPKIVQGKLGRFFRENVLLEQEMLVDAEKGESVEKYAARYGTTVTNFIRREI
jgi:elongation factor Ts